MAVETYEIEEQVAQPVEEPTPTPAPAAEDPPPAPDPQSEVEILRAEIARYREESRHWSEQARKPQAPAPAPAPVEDALPEDAEGFTDLLAKNGPKVIDQYLRQKGFISKAEAEQIADQRANEIVEAKTRTVSAESRIEREFPDLSNAKSPLYLRTSELLQEMVSLDPNAAKSPASLYAAAKAAKAELEARKPAPVAPAPATREQRIAAQTMTRSYELEDDGSMSEVDLTPGQQRMAKMLGVSDKDYAVQLSATRGRRR